MILHQIIAQKRFKNKIEYLSVERLHYYYYVTSNVLHTTQQINKIFHIQLYFQ